MDINMTAEVLKKWSVQFEQRFLFFRASECEALFDFLWQLHIFLELAPMHKENSALARVIWEFQREHRLELMTPCVPF